MSGLDPLLAHTLDTLGEGVALFDDAGALLRVNRAFRTMNPGLADLLSPGLSWDVLLREAAHRAALPDDTCKALAVIEADMLEGPEAMRHLRVETGRGHAHTLQLSPSPGGGFVLVQSQVPSEGAEGDAQHDLEELLTKVLDASPACLTMSRVGDGQIIYRSPAASALLGLAKSSFSHFARREERADFITALLPDGRVDDMRVTGVRGDGSEFPAGISARLIDYGGEEVIVSDMEDLSARLAVQAELARQRAQVFQAEKMSALGELLAGVAHELNNPLSVIVGNAEFLHEDLEGSAHAPRIGKIGTAADRCVRIVRSFLSMARQEPLDPRPTALAGLLDLAVDTVQPLAGPAGITLSVELPPVLAEVMVDEVQVSQVAINLLTNAVHAIADSGIGDAVTVTAGMQGDVVAVSVSDNGPGVPEQIARRIFDPLFTTKEVGKGTGVGLAFCHRVVAAHGGEIHLDPGQQAGARFVLTLPVARL
ncbi:ATP-binding protein [Sulfitobacter sp. D35]|uniref:PAS domain-containing sensor histidine kinase n=1 Tax=Sulfitobacter sp. D35 TaxID=3083252 RepID=UPI00296FEEF4|nr:ATP-binding protein [Sulfitobacter sp. D35]MDW4500357.1 ATP-binding protein [Sulfitobacter sp. D35]